VTSGTGLLVVVVSAASAATTGWAVRTSEAAAAMASSVRRLAGREGYRKVIMQAAPKRSTSCGWCGWPLLCTAVAGSGPGRSPDGGEPSGTTYGSSMDGYARIRLQRFDEPEEVQCVTVMDVACAVTLHLVDTRRQFNQRPRPHGPNARGHS
jgi:hypothetical protein